MIEQLGAGSRVQVLQLLHRNLRLNVHNAQDEGRVLNLEDQKEQRELHFYLQFIQVLYVPNDATEFKGKDALAALCCAIRRNAPLHLL